MPEPTDVVGVLRVHLDEIHTALYDAGLYFESMDLAEKVRSGSMSSKPSRTTQRILKARDRVAGYLETEDDESVPEE